VPALVTDESKLSQILRNLIANALKFTEHGSIAVRARSGVDGQVVFEVEDTGIGIAPEHVDDIFEEFAQVEGPHQHRVRGTGLGLPLSRRLAELLGGDISVQSRLGRGSVFRVLVPAVYPGLGDVPASVSPDEPVALTALIPAGKVPRILIVDDDEASRYVLRRWLEDRFRVLEAVTGRDGVELAMKESPDAIFLDVVMPDLTGFEVLERLQAESSTATVPVIVYTSLSLGENDRRRLERATALVRKSTASRVADRSAVEEALVKAGLATGLEVRHD
jgi:CheY-like chemotaxis protein